MEPELDTIKASLQKKSASGIARAVAAVMEKEPTEVASISSSWADSCPSDNEYESTSSEDERPRHASPTQESVLEDIQVPIFYSGTVGRGIASLSKGSIKLDNYVKDLDGSVTAEDLNQFIDTTRICWDHHIFRKRTDRALSSKMPQFLRDVSNCKFNNPDKDGIAMCYNVHGISMDIEVKGTVYPFIIVFGRHDFFDVDGASRIVNGRERYDNYYLKNVYIDMLVSLYKGDIPDEWRNVIERAASRTAPRAKKPINSPPKRILKRPTRVVPSVAPTIKTSTGGPLYASVAAGKVIPNKFLKLSVSDCPEIFSAAGSFDDEDSAGNYILKIRYTPATASINVTWDAAGDSSVIAPHVKNLKQILRKFHTTTPIEVIITHDNLSHTIEVLSY